MILKDFLDSHATKQPYRHSEVISRVENGYGGVEGFVEDSMRAISAATERQNGGETVDFEWLSDTVRDIRVFLGSLIPELCSQAERVKEVLRDIDWLSTRAKDVELCIGAKYLAENWRTIFRLDNEIHNVLLQEDVDDDIYNIACSGRKQLSDLWSSSLYFKLID